MPPAGTLQAAADNSRPPSHANLSEDDRAELEKLEAAATRMQKHTRPDPYLVTIAQDEKIEYRHQFRQQQYLWQHRTPFRYEEGEGVQYQTFNFSEPGSTMLSLHAQYYPEERPGTADSTRNVTGSNTPAQGPKKVISFGAYKKKQTGGESTRESSGAQDADTAGKKPAVKGPAERVKAMEAESADMLKDVEGNEKEEATHETPKIKGTPREDPLSSKAPKPELKRKRNDNSTASSNAPDTNGHRSPPPVKKVRSEATAPRHSKVRSPSPNSGKRSPNMETQMPPKLSPLHNVPPKLSPLHDVPPKLSPLRDEPQSPDVFELPPRISPDLPDNITAALRATDGKSSKGFTRKPGADMQEDGLRNPTSRGEDSNGPRSQVPREIPKARSSSRSPEREQEADAPTKDTEQVSGDKDSEKGQRPSIIAKLKYKKSRKEDVQRILKLKARPAKHIASPTTPASSDDEEAAEPASTQKRDASNAANKTDQAKRSGKGVAQKVGPAMRKSEEKQPLSEKRPRAEPTEALDNAEPPTKRKKVEEPAPEPPAKKRQTDGTDSQNASKKKAPSALDLKKPPSTPVAPPAPSPAVSSVQKNHVATPAARKDLLHPKRETPSDSQNGTPSGQPDTPTDRSSQPNGTASRPPSSNPQAARASVSQAWDTEQRRLEKLGRDLKHAASDLLKNKPSSAGRRIAAAKSIESLVCYLLAFTCSDRAALLDNKNPPVVRTWRTLTPFCNFVDRTTGSYTSLNGLASGLSVVIYSHILDMTARYPREGPSRDSIIELSSGLRKAAVHAEENLDVDALTSGFPKSWAARSKTSLATPGAGEFGEPRKLLHGRYRLPLGVQTDVLQAARAGLALVKEWVAAERLEYEFKLGV